MHCHHCPITLLTKCLRITKTILGKFFYQVTIIMNSMILHCFLLRLLKFWVIGAWVSLPMVYLHINKVSKFLKYQVIETYYTEWKKTRLIRLRIPINRKHKPKFARLFTCISITEVPPKHFSLNFYQVGIIDVSPKFLSSTSSWPTKTLR